MRGWHWRRWRRVIRSTRDGRMCRSTARRRRGRSMSHWWRKTRAGSLTRPRPRRCTRPAATSPPQAMPSTRSPRPISTKSSRPGIASARPMWPARSSLAWRSSAMPTRGPRCGCGWNCTHLPTLQGVLAALAQRDLLLWRWLTFMQRYPLVVMPTLGDMAPPHNLDTTREGQARVLDSLRVSLISPLLGVPALAVPVGNYGRLRPGVQILAPRFREDLCLDAGEVIEAAEGVVTPIDPLPSLAA